MRSVLSSRTSPERSCRIHGCDSSRTRSRSLGLTGTCTECRTFLDRRCLRATEGSADPSLWVRILADHLDDPLELASRESTWVERACWRNCFFPTINLATPYSAVWVMALVVLGCALSAGDTLCWLGTAGRCPNAGVEEAEFSLAAESVRRLVDFWELSLFCQIIGSSNNSLTSTKNWAPPGDLVSCPSGMMDGLLCEVRWLVVPDEEPTRVVSSASSDSREVRFFWMFNCSFLRRYKLLPLARACPRKASFCFVQWCLSRWWYPLQRRRLQNFKLIYLLKIFDSILLLHNHQFHEQQQQQ